MSKQIKQMEMDALKQTFQDVRDLVMLSASGVSCQADNQLRLDLRKKNIRLQVVKNSLARRVFDEIGIKVGNVWEGPTLLAWGAASIADLSRTLDALIKKNDKIKVKAAVIEGQAIPFQQALTMPTKPEALGQIVAMMIGPASQIASQIIGPASQIASQIKTLSEKSPPGEPAAAPA
ncbi:MAG TPA: 50S ribosomal protein L10 [Gemmataceae bacterium]|nr:50S ribosomal protein L10 [Gemmataceae bacterium]